MVYEVAALLKFDNMPELNTAEWSRLSHSHYRCRFA
jgi:hypothetical protein